MFLRRTTVFPINLLSNYPCWQEALLTRIGCKTGASCPFRHEPQTATTSVDQATEDQGSKPDQKAATSNAISSSQKHRSKDGKATITNSTATSSAHRPVPEAARQDPRSFQIKQIALRHRPEEEIAQNGDTILHFGMAPSDPDFPFDIDTLKCTLRIPSTFPSNTRPTLRVTNREMERGYQINIEQGFDAIWTHSSAPTLLNVMKSLDKQLEALLTAQKADIIKLVANSGPRPPVPMPTAAQKAESKAPSSNPPPASKAPDPPPAQKQPPKPEPISSQRRDQARIKRESEVQILEHRLGRDPQFSKAAGGTVFTVPMEPRKKNELPNSVQALKVVRLLVPLDYDIEPASIELVGVDGCAAAIIEQAFFRRARSHPDATLLAQINYLGSNMHLMVKEPIEKVDGSNQKEDSNATTVETSVDPTSHDETQASVTDRPREEIKPTDKEHVKVISRPPEWDATTGGEGEDSDTDDSDFSDAGSNCDASSDEGDTKASGTEQSNATSSTLGERGVLISFPGLELHGIELLELDVVNVTVKCERCKDTLDVQRLRPQEDPNTAASDPSTKDNTIHTSCKKCTYPFSLGYRKDILHANSTRAGYLDLDGCTTVDLLPSTFLPTCSSCSTPFPPTQGVTAVRASSALAICRTCHTKLSFHIPETRYLRVNTTAHLPLKQVGRPKKETLGLVTGTELPSRGRCKHYSKSYRWFRFSCCNKVFPCDRCHDAETDHPNEFANRMICGWCSREQGYRPEDCAMQGCRRGVTGRVRTGFWEGGKGTRDKARMSRKDPRKYKRRPGGTVPKKL